MNKFKLFKERVRFHVERLKRKYGLVDPDEIVDEMLLGDDWLVDIEKLAVIILISGLVISYKISKKRMKRYKEKKGKPDARR